jgi:hypothetical protein
MSPTDAGKALKSIRAGTAFLASSAVTTGAECVSVRKHVNATMGLNQ